MRSKLGRPLLGVVGAAAAVIITVLAYKVARRPDLATTISQSVPDAAAPPALPTSTAAAVTPDIGPAQVRGWDGTTTDGDLRLDSGGHILIDLALRRLFDYFISARGVLTEEQIAQRLLQQAQLRGFTPAQRDELQQLFDSYRRYLASLASIAVDTTALTSVRTANQARQQLRRAMLGVRMAEAFFAEDEAEENFALARMEILQDKSLSAAQREARLEALLDDLPPALRAVERDSRTLQRLDAKVQALGTAAADPARLYAARSEIVGADAAQRLAVLDAEDAAWKSRMQALEAERSRILASPGLTAAEQQSALESYLEREFSGPDALRARAHLSIVDGNAAAGNPATR